MEERVCALPGCEIVPPGRQATCSAAHRQAWNRLKKRVALDQNKAGLGSHRPKAAAEEAAEADPIELAIEVFKQELTPHVREAITEDTIKAVRAMVKLTPALVESLANDLTSQDAVARGRAQTLVAKYTMGFLDPQKDDKTQPLVINMGSMPTPGDPMPDTTSGGDDTVQQCERCEETKTMDHFEPGAGRCNECQAQIRDDILKDYA